jgi:DNA-binding NarL/FixJ family response regulator
LATTLQRWDAADAHLRASLEISERMTMRPYVARTLLAQAILCTARATPGDIQQAVDLLERAAREIGMAGLYPVIATQRDSITGKAPSRFGLTPREVDVLRLVAQGLTDAEIGGQLGISPRTVNTHIRALLHKLDVPSRAAATRAAVEQQLI